MKRGCAPDLPAYAAVVDVPFHVEDTCAATGTPIRIDFVPDGYEGQALQRRSRCSSRSACRATLPSSLSRKSKPASASANRSSPPPGQHKAG